MHANFHTLEAKASSRAEIHQKYSEVEDLERIYKNFKRSMRRNQNSHLKNYLLNKSAVITYDSLAF